MINALKSDSSGEFFKLNKNLLAKQVPHLRGAGFDDNCDFDVDNDYDGDTVVMI